MINLYSTYLINPLSGLTSFILQNNIKAIVVCDESKSAN